MNNNHILKLLILMSIFTSTHNAHANNISLGQIEFDSGTNILTIPVTYDFTKFSMFGGRLNFVYDPDVIEFVSYTQAQLPPDAAGSPIGSLTAPGIFEDFGIGGLEFFNGIISAGTIGVFEFLVLSPGPGITDCDGNDFCLTSTPTYPFISLAGEDVTAELFANGITVGNYEPVTAVPVPAAVWFLLSGIGVLAGLRRAPT